MKNKLCNCIGPDKCTDEDCKIVQDYKNKKGKPMINRIIS